MISIDRVKYSFGPLQDAALRQQDIPYPFSLVVPKDAIIIGMALSFS